MSSNTLGTMVLAATLLVGCAGQGAALVSVTDEPEGTDCPNGGLKVETGADDDGDGVLDDGEVTDTTFLCNGTDGANGTDGTDGDGGTDGTSVLVTTTTLDPGDATCLGGGVRVDMGVDTDGDGLLGSSEITTMQYVCNGTPGFAVKPVDPPASPPGAYTVDTRGGVGATGSGGKGGDFRETFDPATLGGHAKVFATGRADASFTFAAPASTLGDRPAEIDGYTTVVAYPTGEPTTDGEVHLHDDDSNLYTWDAGADVVATGLSVAVGASLVLAANVGGDVQISFTDGIDNAGTITTTLESDGVSRRGLELRGHDYLGRAGSLVDLRGVAGSGDVGGDGGWLELEAFGGVLFNEGAIDASGGDGTAGGAGAHVGVFGKLDVANTGAITTRGGTGTAEDGGAGGSVYLGAASGILRTSGEIDASGGDGSTAGGGGGGLVLQTVQSADLLNGGDLYADGGDTTGVACDSVTCAGGPGGSISLEAFGGRLVSTGALTARGGDGTAGDGGQGGAITFTATSGQVPTSEDDVYASAPGGDIVVSGDLVTRGGDGAGGGAGGKVEARSTDAEAPVSQEIIFLGYTLLQLDGGGGQTDGGAGGGFYLVNSTPADAHGIPGPSGGAVNHADVSARGGVGTTGIGGAGGQLYLETDYTFGLLTQGEVALQYGAVDVRGGQGVAKGGYGGGVWIYGTNRAENHGPILLGGGEATGDGAYAGSGSYAWVGSDLGPAIDTAAIDASGGDAMGTASTAGQGGTIDIIGWSTADNAGDLSVHGGAANLTDGSGGAGGRVHVWALAGTSTNSGDMDIAGGEAASPGAHGRVEVGDDDLTGSFLP